MGLLDGKVAVITGAGSGMGKASAKVFVREGARVVAADISGAEKDTAAEVGEHVLPVHCDVTREADVEGAIRAAVDEYGRVDIVCNVAGVGGFWLDIGFPLEEWDRLIAINLTATWLICQSSLPHLLATGDGAIVNTASTAATDATPYETAYAATKGAVIALTRTTTTRIARCLRTSTCRRACTATAIARCSIRSRSSRCRWRSRNLIFPSDGVRFRSASFRLRPSTPART